MSFSLPRTVILSAEYPGLELTVRLQYFANFVATYVKGKQ
jgi:hypothetical protein